MKQQAIGQGYNEAFKNAQQAQQYGSTLGLQGLNTALQGVNQAQQGYQGATQAGVGLGNIGSQQGQYGLAALGLQNQIANQQYNQPYQNLQFMQGMMSGLPISSQTTQGYQAPPNALSQIGGLGTTALGAYGLADKMGVFKNIKNPFTTPSDLENPLKYNPNGGVINSGISYPTDGGGYVTSGGNEINLGEYSAGAATGGYIRNGGVKSYASGGLVTLAINNALKG
jgi:hypothetical protein